jgi:hypothetical protein
MANAVKMLVFDIRFGREPLHTLAGHRNNYMPGLVSPLVDELPMTSTVLMIDLGSGHHV